MVVKKTPRTTKSAASPEVPADSTPNTRRPRAAAPKATGDAAAKPKTARGKRVAVPAAAPAERAPVESPISPRVPELNGQPRSGGQPPANRDAYRPVTEDDIRLRAYFLSLEHRGQGSPEYFWELAERELRQRVNRQ